MMGGRRRRKKDCGEKDAWYCIRRTAEVNIVSSSGGRNIYTTQHSLTHHKVIANLSDDVMVDKAYDKAYV